MNKINVSATEIMNLILNGTAEYDGITAVQDGHNVYLSCNDDILEFMKIGKFFHPVSLNGHKSTAKHKNGAIYGIAGNYELTSFANTFITEIVASFI